MKKRTKILFIILIVLVLPIGGIAYWQRQNIQALLEASRYSKEELATQIDEQKAQVESILSEYGLQDLNDLTFVEEEAIRKGELTVDEVQQQLKQETQITEQNTAPSPSLPSNPMSTPDSSKTPSAPTTPSENNISSSQALVKTALSNLYALKAEYLGELGALESAAKGEYFALPTNERKGSRAKKLLTKYMSLGLAAESECDAKVASLLSQLRQDLKAINASTSIVSTIQDSYEQEKTLKKAYYLSLVQ